MIQVKEAIIVEGKYDKIKLSSLIDGVIIPTNGFGIFKDKEKMKLIRRLADTNGIIVLTDSDSAGFMIRAKLSSAIDPEKIKHAYIPDILGKEKRKKTASKEGKLGVEGVESKIILEALRGAGAQGIAEEKRLAEKITRQDFYEAGLTGGDNSRQKRQELLKRLDLPENMPANSLFKVLTALFDRQEFFALAQNIKNREQGDAE
ncbi:toprim domain-containing protein [Scatolibacter rhodanostii]|uniref:toprim domain-containing protein n=1 Tax=Scatolibacter rhodanostii TaxID=2014781 RepID=UPI000C08B446|nr:DUF4093 domain-containing protein [Scatolibacter rhodanostii]